MDNNLRYNQIPVSPSPAVFFKTITINVINHVYDFQGVWRNATSHRFFIQFNGNFVGENIVINMDIPLNNGQLPSVNIEYYDGEPQPMDSGYNGGQQWISMEYDDSQQSWVPTEFDYAQQPWMPAEYDEANMEYVDYSDDMSVQNDGHPNAEQPFDDGEDDQQNAAEQEENGISGGDKHGDDQGNK